MIKKQVRTSDVYDLWDTGKLMEARQTMLHVLETNYGATRKVRLLATVIRKLDVVINDHGTRR